MFISLIYAVVSSLLCNLFIAVFDYYFHFLKACALSKQRRMALELFEELKERNLKVNSYIYMMLFK